MHDAHTLRTRRARAALRLLLLAGLCLAPAAAALAQTDADRRRAFQLVSENNYAEAIPLLEKVTAANPSDREAWERLGLALGVTAQSLKDPEARKKQRVRARNALLKFKELGGTSDLAEMFLSEFPADGSDPVKKYSQNPEADRLMHEGEAAFAGGKMEQAFAAYERALQLDPKIYTAALFAGDTFLHRQQFDKAGEWYARAIKIDPDAETAYRYWGNVLMRAGRTDEARDKYVEAIIADPYNGYVWRNGIFRWAQAAGVRLGHPKIDPPTTVTRKDDKNVSINIDPKSLENKADGSSAWLTYGIARAAWQMEKFKKQFPAEKEYRHTLAEEADALRAVVEGVKTQQREGRVQKLEQSLASLVELHDKGLLEAYVLLGRPDEGIAKDYVAYRRANRDKLRRYLVEYVAADK